MAFKNPNDLAKSMITSNDELYRGQLKQLGYKDEEMDEMLKGIAKSESEAKEREKNLNALNDWKKQNEQKPRSTTPDQLEKIRQAAIKEFGLTNNYGQAFYMLPDGRMLNGGMGQRYGRYTDHREINSPYTNAGVELYEEDQGGNSTNMLDFMRGGHIRMIPESSSIDIMSKPTDQQMNNIYRMWKSGKLDNIQISNPNDKYGQQLDYLENIQSERQIADLIRKYFK